MLSALALTAVNTLHGLHAPLVRHRFRPEEDVNMRVIDEKRQKIVREMESGRGSGTVFPHPVSLEPPFSPFIARREKASFLKSLFKEQTKCDPAKSEKAESNGSLQFIRIKPGNDDKNSLEISEQLILSLPGSSPTAFEIVRRDNKVCFQLSIEKSYGELLISQFGSHFPGAEA